MSESLSTDVLIVGGGVAGLWLNARLRRLGYSTLLVDKGVLGGGQSVKSQGIIHGGTKYALSGALTGASEAIADMPRRYRQAGPLRCTPAIGRSLFMVARHPDWQPHQLLRQQGGPVACRPGQGR